MSDISRQIWDMKYRFKAADGTPIDSEPGDTLARVALAASQAEVPDLRAHWAGNNLPCIMHCFTGNAEQARECIDLGFFLAFGGVATFPKAEEIRQAARITPSDRLLIETDSPYLAPMPHRGKRNEPAFVAHPAKVIAEIRAVSVEQLGAETTANFERLFNLNRVGKPNKSYQLH